MLTASLTVAFSAVQAAARDLTTVRAPVDYARPISLGNGVGANQADSLFTDSRTLAASASESLDLAGTLVDAIGQTVTLARVKGLIVYAAPGNTNDLLIGGAAANGWASWVGDPTDKIRVKPGGLLVLMAPGATAYPVTAGTGDQLQVANSGAGTSVTYDVILIGTSA